MDTVQIFRPGPEVLDPDTGVYVPGPDIVVYEGLGAVLAGRSPWVKVVQAQPENPARALIPPRDTPLPERDREHYADNAPVAWVKPNA